MLRSLCRPRIVHFSAEFGFGIALLALAWTSPARAQHRDQDGGRSVRTHEVAEGETLGEIAEHYGVTLSALEEANDLADPDRLRVGQSLDIPAAAQESGASREPAESRRSDESGGDVREARVTRAGVVLYVAEGQTLSDIAGSYGVSVSRILRASELEDANALRVGQRLLIPGAAEVVRVRRARQENPGSNPVTFLRVSTDEEVTVRLFDGRGRLRAEARDQVEHLFRQPSTGASRRINTELLRMIQKVADHWPGKRIWIYSGYRPYRRSQHTPKSKHNTGHAVDFRVEDVDNDVLRDYCRTLSRAGIGYYPNSHFVHLDARDRHGYWVDYSRPGEAPRYGREGRDPEADESGDAAAAADRENENEPAATRERRRDEADGGGVPAESATEASEPPSTGDGEAAAETEAAAPASP
jgi:uncharacterized protein YcbK (DUF882 family)